MSCFHPITGYQARPGAPLSFSVPQRFARRLEVPCGRCVGCRLEYARQWAVRCTHEASLHEENCFVTFTYDAENLPADLSLNHRHFQLFMKRLRKYLGVESVRYYMCGEYGERYSRPHYHACLFGFSPVDKVRYRRNARGDWLFTSKLLDRLWSCGACFVGSVTFESAGYCARYVMKKVGSDGPMREIFNVETGEIFLRAHEYCRMSLRPGVGADWFAKYKSDVYPSDRLVMRGAKSRPPKYYDTLMGRIDSDLLEKLKVARVKKADVHFDDTMPYRLRAREAVSKAAISRLKRSS